MTTTRDVFRVFFAHLKPYRLMYGFILTLITASQVVSIIAPLFYKKFFDLLASGGVNAETAASLRGFLLVIVGIHLIQWLFKSTSDLLSVNLTPKVMAGLEQSAFASLNGHSYTFFTNNFVGSLTRRIKRLSDAFDTINDAINWTFLPTSVLIIGSIIVLSQRSPIIAVGLLTWVFLYLLASVGFSVWKIKYDEPRSAADSAASAAIADALTNNTTIKLFSGSDHELNIFRATIERWRVAIVKSWRLGAGNEAIQWLLMIILEISVLLAAVRFWQQGLLTIGDFALLQSYLISVFMHVWDMGRTIRRCYEATANAKEMVEIMHTPHEIRDRRGAKEIKVKKGVITFRNVFFRYGKARLVLDGFNLTVKSKEKVALVGPSGAGKSTVVKLILRFHDIQKGKIIIDNQDIKKITQDSLRDAIAMVPQDPVLFHRSLMDNIRYGRREATDKEVISAATKAHCHEFISQLPDGYNTFVGERGIKLSGGERQRVAIARAILKDAPILILDEATSSLDSASEQLIQSALSELMKNKTTIVIAHRLSTILKMDRIVVVSGGKVVDQGTHSNLTKKVGIYKTLWEIQAGGFIQSLHYPVD